MFNPLTPMSDQVSEWPVSDQASEWPSQNFSLFHPYNIMHTSDENKEKCQLWDY